MGEIYGFQEFQNWPPGGVITDLATVVLPRVSYALKGLAMPQLASVQFWSQNSK